MKWGIIVFGMMIFLAACGPEPLITQNESVNESVNETVNESVALIEITPQPLVNKTVELCTGVTCGLNEECKAGQCFCSGEFKQCGSDCIPERSFCVPEDCPGQFECQEGQCIQTTFCKFGEEWDGQQCACSTTMQWCADQKTCIPFDHCCDIVDCNPAGGRNRRCMDTRFESEICMVFEGGTHCRDAMLGERTTLFVGTDSADVYVDAIYQQGTIDVRIDRREQDEVTIEGLKQNKSVSTNGLLITYVNTTVEGGNCKSN